MSSLYSTLSSSFVPSSAVSGAPVRERIVAAILGAVCGDASAMGTHWIYDPAQLLTTLGDNKAAAAPEYQPQPPQPSFYSSSDFPGHYGAGQLSPYGEQLVFVTDYAKEMAAAASSTSTTSASCPVLEASHLTLALQAWATSFGGRPDHALTLTLENIAKQEAAANGFYGASDEQAHAFVKAIPITALYANEPLETTLRHLDTAIRVHQNHDTAVAFGSATAVLLRSVLGGASMSQALTMTVEWVTAQATTTVAYEKVRQALADAHTYASDKLTPEQVVAAMGGENIMYNRSCSLPAAFIIPLYFLYGVVADQGAAAVTTPAVYSRVLRANMLVAGDTCSRAILLGAVLGAAAGSVPPTFYDPLDASVKKQAESAAHVLADFTVNTAT
jgi:hypothetical protein